MCTDTRVCLRTSARDLPSSQASFAFGTALLSTPSQRPWRAATASAVGDPNSVRGPARATADSPGLARSSTEPWTMRAMVKRWSRAASWLWGWMEPPTTMGAASAAGRTASESDSAWALDAAPATSATATTARGRCIRHGRTQPRKPGAKACTRSARPLGRELVQWGEVLLASAAHGADPIARNLLERSSRRHTAVRVTLLRVVDEPAGLADPLLLYGRLAQRRARVAPGRR